MGSPPIDHLAVDPPLPARAVPRARLALFAMLGFSAGLPFLMFSSVLALRLIEHGASLGVVGFFAWVALLPTFKFVWAPLLDRVGVPGLTRCWGRRRGWIMLAQLGIAAATTGLALTADDADIAVAALFAVLLAFWTTTLEIAADAWRIEIAPTEAEQGPLVAANVWGYRTAMVAAGSGALIVADHGGWTLAYLLVAVAALAPFPVLVASAGAGRVRALATGLAAGAAILAASAVIAAVVGTALFAAARALGVTPQSNVTPVVLLICLLPFVVMAIAIPRIRRMGPDARWRRSAAVGAYVDVFWRYGSGAIAIMALVSLYRMGDVLALTLSKPLVKSLGYSLTAIGVADGAVALAASMAGVALGGWLATRWPQVLTLALGAILAGIGNWGFVWLAGQPPGTLALYAATAADQFGNGFAGTVFVVYLSVLVNPRHAGAQYAFLSGFAFLLPRLMAGASGAIQARIGYDGFFLLAGALSVAAVPLLPLVARLRPRGAE